MDRRILVKPPALDPAKAGIENALELTELADIGPDIFTNTRPLWHPPGARGIYGGAVIAQCLAAAQRTVPSNFTVHSMHCYFVLAGDSEIPVMYYVEHVREGKSFATRTVQARQRGKCIFTTTLSFVRENSGGKNVVSHALPLPTSLKMPVEETEQDAAELEKLSGYSPVTAQREGVFNSGSEEPHTKKTRQWMRARGRISPEGGHQAHLAALAYMSDSYFIGTVSRIHGLWRWGAPLKDKDLPTTADTDGKTMLRLEYIKRAQAAEGLELDPTNKAGKREIGMMVSLDHTIYFHEPRRFRADEWMFTEMSSPWAGDGRGVVTQSIHAMDGTLLATCFQEGVVRLKDPSLTKL